MYAEIEFDSSLQHVSRYLSGSKQASLSMQQGLFQLNIRQRICAKATALIDKYLSGQ